MLPKQPKAALAFTALALLTLSACGGGENTASSASPTASSSVSVSASASTSTTASVEASPSESTAYSGGSKAPAGEYRPADEHGPAQNVPKPKAPEGMNVETLEGLEKFITYWNDMRNYAIQTGDVVAVRNLVDDSFEQEQKFYSALQEMYQHDGWVIGGGRDIHYRQDFVVPHGNGTYSIGANFDVKDSIFWLGGKAIHNDNSEAIFEGVELQIQYSSGKWSVLTANVVK